MLTLQKIPGPIYTLLDGCGTQADIGASCGG